MVLSIIALSIEILCIILIIFCRDSAFPSYETKFYKFLIFILSVLVGMTIMRIVSENETGIKIPPNKSNPTTANELIVTGICTFGDCPVATSLYAAEETACTISVDSTTEEESEYPNTYDNEDETEYEFQVINENTDEDEYDDDAYYSPDYFRRMGEIYWNDWRWTWYSERVLPGTGLHIPGSHSSGGYVRDENGYICLASDVLDYGTVIATPFGSYGKVYDSGCDYDTIDVYVSW